MHFLIVTIHVFLFVKCACSAKVLGVFPLEWGSHYILGSKLMKGLAEAGHDITFISPRKYKNPPRNGSWTDVVVEEYVEGFEAKKEQINLYDDHKKSDYEKMKGYADLLFPMSNHTLRHPNVLKLIHSNQAFDVVILDNAMNDCHHVLSYRFKCPLILLSTFRPHVLVNIKVGNPTPVSTVANFLFVVDESRELTFIERLKNLFHNIFIYLFMNFYQYPYHNRVVHELFPDAPDINELSHNVSLILVNSHTSLVNAVPLVPNMVEIGGYHIDPPQKLQQDLQNFLDYSKDGVIYFSMGSSLKSKDMADEKKKLFLNVFKKLKQNVLWKFEDDLPEKPENMLIMDWLPQQDILAHPNIRLFITHGGILSTTEAIHYGVPVLAIPVFLDQEMNALKAEQIGVGLKISYNDPDFTEKTLHNLLQELLYNPTYKENAQHRSRLYHDRPMTPMQSVVYWVEYVVRHKGAPHLRVAGVGMPWYKYFMVDVLVFLFFNIVLFMISIKYVFTKLLGEVATKSARTVKKKIN